MEWFKKKPRALFTTDAEGRKHLTEEGKRQFAHWEGEGKIHQVCEVHILDPMYDQPRVETWRVTPEPDPHNSYILRATYEEHRAEDANLYAIIHYVEGKPQWYFAPKKSWDYMRAQIETNED